MWIKAWEAVWSSDNVVFQMSGLSISVISDSGLASIHFSGNEALVIRFWYFEYSFNLASDRADEIRDY